MKIRITDQGLAGEELVLDVDETQWYDEDEVQLNEDEVNALLDWWSTLPGRAADVHDDGGHIVIVETDMDSGNARISWWCQESNDWSWPLESFPTTALSYEVVAP